MDDTAKGAIFSDNDIGNMITRAIEALKVEFAGEGQYYKDSNYQRKYSNALIKLQLYDMCEIKKYICVFQDYYYRYAFSNPQFYLNTFYTKIPNPR
jgi:hypothetical protein